MTYKDVILQIFSEIKGTTVKEITPEVANGLLKLDPEGNLDKELSDEDATKLFAQFRSQLPAVKMWLGECDVESLGGQARLQ